MDTFACSRSTIEAWDDRNIILLTMCVVWIAYSGGRYTVPDEISRSSTLVGVYRNAPPTQHLGRILVYLLCARA